MRKLATIIAAPAQLRIAGTMPVASFSLASNLSETNAECEAVGAPFFQSCEVRKRTRRLMPGHGSRRSAPPAPWRPNAWTWLPSR